MIKLNLMLSDCCNCIDFKARVQFDISVKRYYMLIVSFIIVLFYVNLTWNDLSVLLQFVVRMILRFNRLT